jgi:hypothetical protein
LIALHLRPLRATSSAVEDVPPGWGFRRNVFQGEAITDPLLGFAKGGAQGATQLVADGRGNLEQGQETRAVAPNPHHRTQGSQGGSLGR